MASQLVNPQHKQVETFAAATFLLCTLVCVYTWVPATFPPDIEDPKNDCLWRLSDRVIRGHLDPVFLSKPRAP